MELWLFCDSGFSFSSFLPKYRFIVIELNTTFTHTQSHRWARRTQPPLLAVPPPPRSSPFSAVGATRLRCLPRTATAVWPSPFSAAGANPDDHRLRSRTPPPVRGRTVASTFFLFASTVLRRAAISLSRPPLSHARLLQLPWSPHRGLLPFSFSLFPT
ncbi:hypothetical protein SESBI_50213 [Sesbania bispinosa]|nr:hypothetical protein SESBI_50213 [Sesbania bispinosa]